MRTIGVVTVSRSDFGIYSPILKKIKADKNLKLHLIVAGMHWLKEFGETVCEIEREGFKIGDAVKFSFNEDSPAGIVQTMGEAVCAFGKSYQKCKPDILLVLGDRFETQAAALAALPFKIPVAHLHGGELTHGAIDDALRHSVTKLSHLHFVSTEEYGRRVRQMGEEPWRVVVSGAPALDHLSELSFLNLEKVNEEFGLRLKKSPILVTFNPVTLEYKETDWQVEQLFKALEPFDTPAVFTFSNADTSNSIIRKKVEDYVAAHSSSALVLHFGTQGYFSLMALSVAMVGNSSSGLVEAPSFALPVVNIGTRQGGRIRAKNVIDVGYATNEIQKGIEQALSPKFRAGLKEMKNPYGDGHASEKIVERLKTVALDDNLIRKKFEDHYAK